MVDNGGRLGDIVETWGAVYPVITVLLLVIEPHVVDLLLPVRTLLLSVLLVPTTVLWTRPAMGRLRRRFR
ncbi:MAG: hypothetical protein AAGH76_10765 [Pseudomonadota bacterium]